ncbi:MAG TPA: single-stranded DNA-binding protein, partial [Ilumatobacteraceae bacterium]|nr:single-stranded DNA-binding protein [Ilumatobacteraceae bacterium]
RDPELRFTQSGRGNATFGVAVSRRYQQNNEWVEQTSFFNVVAWGTLGENAASSLQKGARIIVTGRLEQRSFDTQQGERRSVVEIVADEIGPSLRWATATVERTSRDASARAATRVAVVATRATRAAATPVVMVVAAAVSRPTATKSRSEIFQFSRPLDTR